MGLAYLLKRREPLYVSHNLPSEYNKIEFQLGALKPSENGFILHGKQTHLLLVMVHDLETDNFYGLGYLTSKKNEYAIAKDQYQKFEKSKEGEIQQSSIEKIQYINVYPNLEQISKDDIIILKWGEDYLSQDETLTSITKIYGKMHTKDATIYHNVGPTKKDYVKMCKDFDDIVNNKKKHPQTQSQIT